MEQKKWHQKTTLWVALFTFLAAVVALVQGLLPASSAWAAFLPPFGYMLKEAAEKLAQSRAYVAEKDVESSKEYAKTRPTTGS